MCRAEASFFVAPSEARGPSALTRLGRIWMGCRPEPLFFVEPRRKPRGLPRVDAVPSEARDASLSLGRTKMGARQNKVEGLF